MGPAPTRGTCCPVPRSTSRPRWRRCARSWPTSATGAPTPSWSGASGSTASGRRRCGCPWRPCSRRSPTSTRRSATRWRSRSGAPGWFTPTSAAPTPRRRSCPGAPSPSAGCRSSGSGCTCPGGRAVYPSSVVMNVVPAQVAGVASLAVASPPQRDSGGLPHPTILAACALLGVDEVYAAGARRRSRCWRTARGQCRAGRRWSPGPGNIYVTAAKRLLKGRIGIDAEAGPTEIAVLADDSADPAHVAADLISQAEHDVVAASVLVTDSAALADAVEAELAVQVAATKHSRARRRGAVRAAERDRARRRPRRRAGACRRVRAPSTWRSRPATRRRSQPGCATRARSSSARGRRCRSATTSPARTTCCRPVAAPATPRVCRCRRSCAGSTSSTTTSAALRGVAHQSWRSGATPRTCRPTGRRVQARFRGRRG